MTQVILQLIALVLTLGGGLIGAELLEYKASRRYECLPPNSWFLTGKHVSARGVLRAQMIGRLIGAVVATVIAVIVVWAA